MSTVKSRYSPLHTNCTIGQPFGNPDPSYALGYHTGTDFPASGVFSPDGVSQTVNALDLYACCDDGEVVYVYKDATGNGGSVSLGNQVQIYDKVRNLYFRYCHLDVGSVCVNVGDSVTTQTKIGVMGNTGNSTGTHLHLECTTEQSWSSHTFVDPVQPLGIPNERGTIVEYDGSIIPIKNKHKYRSAILLRKKLNIF